VPVIALTANALSGNREMFLSKGFDSYISKPIDVLQLDRELDRWVRPRHMQERRTGERRMGERRTGDRRMTDRREPAGKAPRPEKNLENLENMEKLKNLLPALSLLEGVDLEEGVLRYGGDAEYVEILRSFWTHTPHVLERLRNPAEEFSSLKDYAIAVHGLKGASRGIGAEEVGDLAEELENAAKDGDFRKVREKSGPLVDSLEVLLSNIGRLLEDIAKNLEETGLSKETTSARERRDEPDPALLEKIKDGAARMKILMMEEALRELERYDYDHEGELVSWLREQTEALEYSAVLERLEGRKSAKSAGESPTGSDTMVSNQE
jgi:CheY-like chemotaxis protein